jgi:3'-5' exoribonuclease
LKVKISTIKNLVEGKIISGFFICKKFNVKVSRLGDPFIDLLLEDSHGNIRAKIWSFVDEYKKQISLNEPCAIKGRVVSFNQSLEIEVYHITKIANNLYDKYGFNKDLLLKKVNQDISLIFKNVIENIKILNHDCKKNVLKLFNGNKHKIVRIPSLDKKYNLQGGFLFQINSVMELNKKMPKSYKYDRNLVSLGILIKNIGLIDYFDDNFNKVEEESLSKGYTIKSYEIIKKYFGKYDDIFPYFQTLIIKNKLLKFPEINIVKYLYKIDLLMRDE